MTGRRYDPVELDALKGRTALSDLFERYGIRAKGKGSEKWAMCCFHGEKTASLKIDDKKGFFHCFGCGASGDHFAVLQQLGGKTFHEAVEVLGGTRFVTVEERQQIEARNKQWAEEERVEKQKGRTAAERTFEKGQPVAGTHVEAYLAARGLPVTKRWTFDLRFIAQLPYKGFASAGEGEATVLGSYPAMVAAIRDASGTIIGVHRTYLDPQKPVKLTPPGDQKRNKAKKVLGEATGGMIRLSPITPRLAMGEGIETSQAWFALGEGGDDISITAAVSLGNLSGGCTAFVEHPTNPDKRIPNGEPDMDRPGVVLPQEVEEVILLGDGDSEPKFTMARLLTAGRRFRQQGRKVAISFAPEKMDWNDVLQAEVAAAA